MNLVHPYDGDEVETEAGQLVAGQGSPLDLDLVLNQVLAAVIHKPLKELLLVLLWLPLEVVDLEEAGGSHLSTIQAFNH